MNKTRKPPRRKPLTVTLPPTLMYRFTEVHGKTIESIKLYLELDDTSLSIFFTDKTQLNFDLEPGLTVRTDLSNWKTGNGHTIKTWPPMHGRSVWIKEPHLQKR